MAAFDDELDRKTAADYGAEFGNILGRIGSGFKDQVYDQPIAAISEGAGAVGNFLKPGLTFATSAWEGATNPNFKAELEQNREALKNEKALRQAKEGEFFGSAGSGVGSKPGLQGALKYAAEDFDLSSDVSKTYQNIINNPEFGEAFNLSAFNSAVKAGEGQLGWLRNLKSSGASRQNILDEIQRKNLSPEDSQVVMAEVDKLWPEEPAKPYEVRDPQIRQVANNVKNWSEGKGDATGNVAVNGDEADMSEAQITWNTSQQLGSQIATANQTHEYWYQDDDFVNEGLVRMGIGILLGEDIGDAWKAASSGYQNSVNRKRRSAYAQELSDMGYTQRAISDYIQGGKLDEAGRIVKQETGSDRFGNVYQRDPFTGAIKKAIDAENVYTDIRDGSGNVIGQRDIYNKYTPISGSGSGSGSGKGLWEYVPGTATSKPIYRNTLTGDVKADPAYMKPEEGPKDFKLNKYFGDSGQGSGKLGTGEERKSYGRVSSSEYAAQGLPSAFAKVSAEAKRWDKENLVFGSAAYEAILTELASGSTTTVGRLVDAKLKKENPELASYLSTVMNTLMPLARDDSGATITETELMREFLTNGPLPTDSPELVAKKMNTLAYNMLRRFSIADGVTPLGTAAAELQSAIDRNLVKNLSIADGGIWFEDARTGEWVNMKEAFGIREPRENKQIAELRAETTQREKEGKSYGLL